MHVTTTRNLDAIVDSALAAGMYQHRAELLPFVEWVVERGLTRNICEIGSFVGGGIELFCQLATNKMISIDLPGGRWGGEHVDWQRAEQRNRAAKAKHPHFVGIVGDSHSDHTWNVLNKILNVDDLDLLFIDGDHSYEGVKSDYDNYRQFVCPGGAIAFHDIAATAIHDRDHVEVRRLWLELEGEKHEFVQPGAPWGGIGVLVV